MLHQGTLDCRAYPAAQWNWVTANRTLPQIEKLLAEAAEPDADDDARRGRDPQPAAPRALARRAERRQQLASQHFAITAVSYAHSWLNSRRRGRADLFSCALTVGAVADEVGKDGGVDDHFPRPGHLSPGNAGR